MQFISRGNPTYRYKLKATTQWLYKSFGNKYRNKHNINQSQTIHITKAEIDMNITRESVHQSSGQTRSTISKRIDTSARQKNEYTS